MAITMKEIARLANVSTASVSKILNGRDDHISDKTRQRVLQIVKSQNFRPNSIAKGLKEKKTYTIGFVLPDIANPFFPEIARGIEDCAIGRGFAVEFCNTDNKPERERDCVLFLQTKMVDGLIFIRSLHKTLLNSLASLSIPLVVVDREIDIAGLRAGRVFVDTKAAIHASTNYLIAKGCKKIAYISADHDSISDRYEGYVEALAENHYPFDPKLVYRDDYNVETGYRGLSEILKFKMIDGLVCGNDLIATGAIKLIQKKQLRVPQDIKVIGMDNIYFAQYLNPALTTIEQPAYKMGQLAAGMLIEHILEQKPLETVELEFALIEREST